MREACIVLPKTRNDGVSAAVAHTSLKTSLLDAFGGYSRSECSGAWRDPATGKNYYDESFMYTVAVDQHDHKADVTLQGIARKAGELAHQEAVYYRAADGLVTIITINQEALQAAA